MDSKQEYSLGEYCHEKQIWIDFITLLLVNYFALSCYVDSLRGGIEQKEPVDQILIKHGGDMNEGFTLAMIANIILLFASYVSQKDFTSSLVNSVKIKLYKNLDSKEQNRRVATTVGAVLVAVAEIFGVGNSADLKDVPAGLLGAGLFYIVTCRNPYQALLTNKTKKSSRKKRRKK